MSTAPLDITGYKQLMVDPRIVAESHNAMTCMAEAEKVGKVIDLPDSMKGLCWPHYGTVVWDEKLGKVRIYYSIHASRMEIYYAVAESADGIHFDTPEIDLERLRSGPCRGIIQINKIAPDCDRMLDAHRTRRTITMDGRLDEPDWQDASATVNFIKTGGDELSEFDTTVRVLHDDEAVYVGYDIQSSPGRLDWEQADSNTDLDRVENIELFIDPRCSRSEYYFFNIGCYGQKRQERHISHDHPAGDAWQDQWKFAIDRRHDGWSAIIKVPFSLLELEKERPGPGWGFNVTYNLPTPNRDEYTRYTSWVGCKPHHLPEEFGALIFDEARFNAEFQPVWEDLRTGRSSNSHRENVCVFIDPNGHDCDRYKLVWCDGGYMHAAVAPDGLTFETQRTIVDKGNLDSTNIAMWDSIRKKYAVYTRWWFREGVFPAQRRGVARMESDRWTTGYDQRQVVMDPKDFPGNEQGYRDFYMPGTFIYENLYLAVPTVYYRNIGFGPLDPVLMVSTDGYQWQWVADGSSIIPRSPNQFDRTRIYAHVPPVQIGDRLYFYYTGHPDGHHEGGGTDRSESGIGAAWIRPDRFLCYHGFTRWPGIVTSTPLLFTEGRELRVNAETLSDNSSLRVEVVGDDRFRADKCRPVTGNHLDMPITWEDADFSDLKGAPIRLRFHLEGARLYAFEVR